MKRQIFEIAAILSAAPAGWFLANGFRDYNEFKSSFTGIFLEPRPNWDFATGIFFAGITVGLVIGAVISKIKTKPKVEQPSRMGV